MQRPLACRSTSESRLASVQCIGCSCFRVCVALIASRTAHVAASIPVARETVLLPSPLAYLLDAVKTRRLQQIATYIQDACDLFRGSRRRHRRRRRYRTHCLWLSRCDEDDAVDDNRYDEQHRQRQLKLPDATRLGCGTLFLVLWLKL